MRHKQKLAKENKSTLLQQQKAECKDGNGSVSGRISVGFEFCRFGFGDDFSPAVFGFGLPKIIGFGFGFGFSPVDTQWITVCSKTSCFIVYLVIILFT